MRTLTAVPVQSFAPSASITFARACSLSSAATAASRSRNTRSAPSVGAFSIARTFVPGTASSLRCSRALSAIQEPPAGGVGGVAPGGVDGPRRPRRRRQPRLARHDGAERGEHFVGGLAVRVHAHQADPPDRRRRRSETATDLQVELAEEPALDLLAV